MSKLRVGDKPLINIASKKWRGFLSVAWDKILSSGLILYLHVPP